MYLNVRPNKWTTQAKSQDTALGPSHTQIRKKFSLPQIIQNVTTETDKQKAQYNKIHVL